MSKRQSVYISGPVTGHSFDDVCRAFADKERELNAAGYLAVNPIALSHENVAVGATWEEFMAFDLTLLKDCDFITFLPGWEDSRGARLEMYFAKLNGVGVFKSTLPCGE